MAKHGKKYLAARAKIDSEKLYTSREALELAEFELPNRFEKDVCELKGVYALDDDIKAWLKSDLGV